MAIATPRKTVDISGANAIYTVSFTQTDFMNSSGNATLIPPYSLSIIVENPTVSVLYVGVVIVTPSKRVNVGDRINIAFVTEQNTLLITPATCPSLANITEQTIGIDVLLYRPGFSSHSSNFAAVQLYIDGNTDYIAPMPIIGRDTIAYNPAIYAVANSGLTIVQNATTNNIIIEAIAITQVRLHIVLAQLQIPRTAFPGDIVGYFRIVQNSIALSGIGHTFSAVDNWVLATFENLILNVGDSLRVVADNTNASVDYTVNGSILYERLI